MVSLNGIRFSLGIELFKASLSKEIEPIEMPLYISKSLTRQENRIMGVEVGGGGVGGAVVQRKHDVDRMLRDVTT